MTAPAPDRAPESITSAPSAPRYWEYGAALYAAMHACGVPAAELLSRDRRPVLVRCREVFAVVGRQRTYASWNELAATLGHNTHSTVLSANKRGVRRLRDDQDFAGLVDSAERLLDGMTDAERQRHHTENARVAATTPSKRRAPDLPDLVSVRDIADMLRRTPKNVRDMAACGRMPKPRREGAYLYWDADEIRAWIDAGFSVAKADRAAVRRRASTGERRGRVLDVKA